MACNDCEQSISSPSTEKIIRGKDGNKAFLYVAYADNVISGNPDTVTGFSLGATPKCFIAIKNTTTEIVSPAQTDFQGLWKKICGNPGQDGDPAPLAAPGEDGSDGRGYKASTSTPLSHSVEVKLVNTGDNNLAYSLGARVRMTYANDEDVYMEGLVTDYSTTYLTVNINYLRPSPSTIVGQVQPWNINLAGDIGSKGDQGNPGPNIDRLVATVSIDPNTEPAGLLNQKIQKSIIAVIADQKIQLDGDELAPTGNPKYYGTDLGGVKGFHKLNFPILNVIKNPPQAISIHGGFSILTNVVLNGTRIENWNALSSPDTYDEDNALNLTTGIWTCKSTGIYNMNVICSFGGDDDSVPGDWGSGFLTCALIRLKPTLGDIFAIQTITVTTGMTHLGLTFGRQGIYFDKDDTTNGVAVAILNHTGKAIPARTGDAILWSIQRIR